MSASMGENSQVQQYIHYPMIDCDSESFMKSEINQLITSSPIFSAPGAAINVISILGVQSSGKSTLLKYLFGHRFVAEEDLEWEEYHRSKNEREKEYLEVEKEFWRSYGLIDDKIRQRKVRIEEHEDKYERKKVLTEEDVKEYWMWKALRKQEEEEDWKRSGLLSQEYYRKKDLMKEKEKKDKERGDAIREKVTRRRKTTWASECNIPNLLVVDVKETVGSQGEGSFQQKDVFFALTISNVIIIIISVVDASHNDEATDQLLKRIFEERLKLKQEKTRLVVVVNIKNYHSKDEEEHETAITGIKERTVEHFRKQCEKYLSEVEASDKIITDMRKYGFFSNKFDMGKYFDVKVTVWGQNMFEEEVAELRKWFETEVFSGFQHKMAALWFSFSAEILWKQIFENTKLDFPAHMDMVSGCICDEAKKQCLAELNSNEDYLSLKNTEYSPQEFSDKLEFHLECLQNRYKVETEMCIQEVRDKKENELINDIIFDMSTYSQKLVTELLSKMYNSCEEHILSATLANPYADVHGLVESFKNEFTDACEVLLPRYPAIMPEENIISAMQSDLIKYGKGMQSMRTKMMEMEKKLKKGPPTLGPANIEKEKKDASKGIDLCQTNDYIEFSRSELEEATDNFDKSCMIGEGGFGFVYRGILRETVVAIKVPKPGTDLGEDFKREVEILSKVKHPNLISLIGANTEAHALVFEFLPNGGLDTFLTKGKLSWPDRIRIASEICSGLIFLHSVGQHGIVHGDLKPANILLDSNLVSKITDFGNSRELQQVNQHTITPLHHTLNIKGTMAYFDPVYLNTGDLTRQSDVFAFGIILLQLVTDRYPEGIHGRVEYALNNYTFNTIVYDSEGEWPIAAKKLALLGLLCSDPDRAKRPDLEKYVLPSIEKIKRDANFAE